jgi:hypothetical protein
MCFYFVYASCKYGKRCRQSHTFKRHWSCFSQRKLFTSLDQQQILKLVRLSELQSIKICSLEDYDECQGECDSFHVCKFHFTGRMCNKAADECLHGHALSKYAAHNERILTSRQLNNIGELDLRNYLHDGYHSFKQKTKISFPATERSLVKTNNSQQEMSGKCVLCGRNEFNKRLGACQCEYCFNCFYQVTIRDYRCLNVRCESSHDKEEEMKPFSCN